MTNNSTNGTEPERYHYYVTYAHRAGTGAIDVTRPSPIASFQDVREITDHIIASNTFTSAVVTNWKRYGEHQWMTKN